MKHQNISTIRSARKKRSGIEKTTDLRLVIFAQSINQQLKCDRILLLGYITLLYTSPDSLTIVSSIRFIVINSCILLNNRRFSNRYNWNHHFCTKTLYYLDSGDKVLLFILRYILMNRICKRHNKHIHTINTLKKLMYCVMYLVTSVKFNFLVFLLEKM